MAPYNIVSIGSHPNIAFYNWRLFNSKLSDITFITSTTINEDESMENIDSSGSAPQQLAFNWSSNQFGNSRYTLSSTFGSVDGFLNFSKTNPKLIDFLFVSANSLQELSTLFLKLSAFLKVQLENNNIPTIIVESTNFVNLEPFIKMTLQLDEEIPILSIMSDYDIRLIGDNNYTIFKSKKESELIYIGKSGIENQYLNNDINLINKISDLFESSNIDVYKLNTPLEFLSYQWKFALPKIAIEPLSIIFEKPFPNDLKNQILAKPLLSGLIFEIITVIKTMGCKLFKSYDNENSLLDRLSQLYPKTDLTADCSEAPKLYYDFFNQNQLYLDLLLLQPILIADDYQVKTPYLEFLYAIMSQFNNNNFSTLSNSTSIFWLRKNAENIKQLKLHQDELAMNNALKEKELKQKNSELNQMQNPKVMKNNYYNKNIAISNENQDMNGNDLEELSEIAHTYVTSEKTPPVQSREFNNTNNFSNNNFSNDPYYNKQPQQQPVYPPNNNNGSSSPNYVPSQNLPHGLPPQGLPVHQPIFSQQPPPPQQIPQQPPQGYGNNFAPRRPHYQQPPMNQYQSQDNMSMMSGASRGYPPQLQNNGYDTSFGSMNSNNILPSNRQFKPTSRKSSRKSTAMMTSNLVGSGAYASTNDPLMNSASRGMPGMPSRHSMMPANPSASNLPQQNFNGRQSMQPRKQNFNNNNNINNNANNLDSFSPPNPAMANGSTANSNGSSTSLAKETLVPVPEATPSPTPAYVPTNDKKDEKKKKKMGGLFGGLKKKK